MMSVEDLGFDESWYRTNPVFCLEAHLGTKPRLLRQEQRRVVREYLSLLRTHAILPSAWAIERLRARGLLDARSAVQVAEPSWGIVGLVFDGRSRMGLVYPIQVQERAAGPWRISGRLPLEEQAMKDLLRELVEAASANLTKALPELVSVSIDAVLEREARGPSMQVAGILAILWELAGRPAALRRSCALVQPEGRRFGPVERVVEKLEAFRREIGAGGVLVRHPACKASLKFKGLFDEVWEVEQVSDLARYLHESRLLETLLRRRPLGATELRALELRVEYLASGEQGRWQAALELLQLMMRQGMDRKVPRWCLLRLERRHVELARSMGWHARSTRGARRLSGRLERGGATTCHEDRADAAVELAASLFFCHSFEEGLATLLPWLRQVDSEERCLSPHCRVKLWTTAGRTRVLLGLDGWRELFERALDIQKHTDPPSVSRTMNYLIHALLRRGPLVEAAELIRRQRRHRDIDTISDAFLDSFEADLARQSGRLWTSEKMERFAHRRGQVTSPQGRYFQATARQPGRKMEDVLRRLHRAVELFEANLGVGNLADNGQVLLIQAMRLSESAQLGDASLWRQTVRLLEHWFRRPANRPMMKWYAGLLGPAPCLESAEAFLARSPYL